MKKRNRYCVVWGPKAGCKRRDGLAMFAGALALGLEGVVAKDTTSPYVEGPLTTWHWQKIKNPDYERKEPVEFHPRKPSR